MLCAPAPDCAWCASRASPSSGIVKLHGRSPCDAAVHPDPPAVRVDDGFADGEPQPDSVLGSRAALAEFVEDMWELIGRNAPAGIRNPEADLPGIP